MSSDNVKMWISFDNEEQILEAVPDGSWTAWTSLGIEVGDEEFSGPNRGYTTGDFDSLLIGLCRSVGDLLENQRRVNPSSYTSSFLVFEPVDDQTVRIVTAYTENAASDPAQRSGIEKTVIAPRTDLIEEILRVCGTGIDSVLDLNPALESGPKIERVQSELKAAKRAYERHRTM